MKNKTTTEEHKSKFKRFIFFAMRGFFFSSYFSIGRICSVSFKLRLQQNQPANEKKQRNLMKRKSKILCVLEHGLNVFL